LNNIVESGSLVDTADIDLTGDLVLLQTIPAKFMQAGIDNLTVYGLNGYSK